MCILKILFQIKQQQAFKKTSKILKKRENDKSKQTTSSFVY